MATFSLKPGEAYKAIVNVLSGQVKTMMFVKLAPPPTATRGKVNGTFMEVGGSGMIMPYTIPLNADEKSTDARKATDVNAPSPAEVGTLHFANEAYNGEMCINFGNVPGGSLGLPGEVGGAVPDFAEVTRGIV